MTEHYTMQEAVKLARENGFNDLSEEYHPMFCQELTTFANAAVTRKLAEKELEVVRLRDRLKTIAGARQSAVGFNDLKQYAFDSISTPPSTEALDAYMKERTAKIEDRISDAIVQAIQVKSPEHYSQAEKHAWDEALIEVYKKSREKLGNPPSLYKKYKEVSEKLKSAKAKLAAAEERVKEYKELCRHSYPDKTFRIQIDYQDLHIREIVSFESAKEGIPHVATSMIVKLLAAIEAEKVRG